MIDLNNYPAAIRLLTENWQSTAGNALRFTLWSMWSWRNAPKVNLWTVLTELPRNVRAELTQLVLLDMEARERVLRAVLQASGEMDRIDKYPLAPGTGMDVDADGESEVGK